MLLKKFLFFLIILSIIITPLTGCWNYIEVNLLGIVTGIAIDKGTDDNIHLTIEIVDLGSGGKDAKISSDIVEVTGSTVNDAIGNALRISAKRLYLEHCQIIILSQEIAKEGIRPVLDFFVRDHEPRLTLNILISKEKTAKEILTQKSITNPLVALEIDDEIESDHIDLSKTKYIDLYQIVDILESKGIALALPVIENVQNNGVLKSSLDGTAIFNDDKMIGLLDSNDSQLFNFSLNEVSGGTLILIDEASKKPIIGLEVFKSQTKISPDYSDNKLKLTMNIFTTVSIGEIKTEKDYISLKGRNQLTNMAQEQLDNDISNFIKKVQNDYGVDIFGFGQLIHQTNPKLWEKIKPEWNQIFRNLDVNVKSNIIIKNSFITRSPIKGAN